MTTPTARRLTPSEAEGLWRAWKIGGDQKSRDRLVLAYMPMVKYLAAKRARELPTYRELDDLVSCGLIAIIEAVDRFDPAKGATFEQYAWIRVTGAIIDELRRLDPVTRSSRTLARSIDRAREAWFARNGSHPSEDDLAEMLHIEVSTLRETLAEVDRAHAVSLNAATSRDEDQPLELGEKIAAEEGPDDPERALLSRERSEQIRNAMATLSERERTVIGLVHVQHLSGVEIGEMLGVSESRISQILSAARQKLSAQLEAYEDAEELVAV